MYMVFVQSNLTVEVSYLDEIPVTVLPCEHGSLTYEIDSTSSFGHPKILFTTHPDEGFATEKLVINDADGKLVGHATFPDNTARVSYERNTNYTAEAVFCPAFKWESYVDENGVEYPIGDDYHLLDEMEDNGNLCLEDGWYLASKSITFHNRARIEGDVNLILLDGTTLKMEKGIRVGDKYGDGTNSLTIWGQKDGTGKLHCISTECELAAIGGNDWENNGVINIHSGVVVAESDGWAAAIGGGNRGSRGTINIYGGQVNAKNVGSGGAGIGCGLDACGNGQINIYGGSIDAGGYSSAIGGGYSSEGGSITIKGGNISAVNIAPPGWFVRGGAGIGSGPFGKEQSIYISGGTIYAEALWVEHARVAHYYSEPIGAGMLGTVDSLIITSNMRETDRTKHTVRLVDQSE